VLAGGDGIITGSPHGGSLQVIQLTTISGGGQIGLGDGSLELSIQAGASVDADGNNPLIINTRHTVANSGTLEATGGGLAIDDAVVNSGTLEADGGNVTIGGNLTGPGQIEIFSASRLELKGSSNNGALSFQNTINDTGVLVLDIGAAFNGTVAGMSYDGTNSDTLDLQDISISTLSWTFKENSGGTGGTLSITDGTHKANIALIGQYLAANGTASSGGANSTLFGTANDGGGGTLVTTTHHAP